ncbi:hypothetical protein QTI66_35465 [Variovorax sp. J22R133]|nr:hypothetical protein [Variovorax sp. J22R133]MDM0117417.1 hypothetical protein [Variovorax sp. J22R133]
MKTSQKLAAVAVALRKVAVAQAQTYAAARALTMMPVGARATSLLKQI